MAWSNKFFSLISDWQWPLLLVAVLLVVWGVYELPYVLASQTQWRGSTVVVTGGGSGIGLEIAKNCANLEVGQIHLVDINSDCLRAATELLLRTPGFNGKVIAHKADVSSEDDIQAVSTGIIAIMEATGAQGPGKDTLTPLVLFNNAGIVTGKRFEDLDATTVMRSFGVNILPSFSLTRALLPAMRARPGSRVVCTSSVMGLIGGSRLADYCASKWALIGVMESLRLELQSQREKNVKVVTVCPYATTTGMFDGMYSEQDNLLRWLCFPLNSSKYVADGIITATGQGRELAVLPWYLGVIAGVSRLMPCWAHDLLTGFMGGWGGMEGFKGSKSAKQLETSRGAGPDAASNSDSLRAEKAGVDTNATRSISRARSQSGRTVALKGARNRSRSRPSRPR